MTKEKLKKIFLAIFAIYTAFVVSFYFLTGDQLTSKQSKNSISMLEADSVTEEIVKGITISQTFVNKTDEIETLEIVFTKNYQEGSGTLTIELLDDNKSLLSKQFDVKDIPEQHRVIIDTKIEDVLDKTLTLKISSDSSSGNGVRVMMNKEAEGSININDLTVNGTLCFATTGKDDVISKTVYLIIVVCLGVALAAALFVSYRNYAKGKVSYLVRGLMAVTNYSFLISQLVARDFKSKYKRSVLGVLWSFLNPLLTMTVQYFVFSTLFGNGNKNYPAYLLIGTVMFSFFSEATTMCLTSITGNANLITKVYVPKYIYPFTRIISSLINFGLTLIPTFVVCLLCGVGFHKSTLLFFYFAVCLIVFTLGIGLILSATTVFFRDIQFLWSVLITIWMYATPIFYPAEIIPEKFSFIIKLNPIYHFIGNARTCIISGISPEPMAYVYCLLFALISLLIGSLVFKKTQDQFTLHL